jgi:hypothetical protein
VSSSRSLMSMFDFFQRGLSTAAMIVSRRQVDLGSGWIKKHCSDLCAE